MKINSLFTSILSIDNFMENSSFLRVQRTGWQLIGFWIGSDSVTKMQMFALAMSCLEQITYGLFQLKFLFESRKNILLAFDAIMPVLTEYPETIRIFFYLWYLKEFKIILDYLKSKFEGKF